MLPCPFFSLLWNQLTHLGRDYSVYQKQESTFLTRMVGFIPGAHLLCFNHLAKEPHTRHSGKLCVSFTQSEFHFKIIKIFHSVYNTKFSLIITETEFLEMCTEVNERLWFRCVFYQFQKQAFPQTLETHDFHWRHRAKSFVLFFFFRWNISFWTKYQIKKIMKTIFLHEYCKYHLKFKCFSFQVVEFEYVQIGKIDQC